MDWSSLGKAILENSNDQGLIFTFKAERISYRSLDQTSAIIAPTFALVTQQKTLASAAETFEIIETLELKEVKSSNTFSQN